MKRIVWFTALLLTIIIAKAQTNDVIKITGTKFPFDIMQQWIKEYTKTHPDVRFQLSKSIPTDSASLQIAAHSFRPGELKDDQALVAVNRYAQLPIVNCERSNLKDLQTKGFTKNDLQDIYFKQTAYKHDIFNTKFNVYKRDKNVCASRSFAENVTGIQSDVAGTLVNGDDTFLLDAVKRDEKGISYNNLSIIYNLKTRKVADSIAVIPIDLNENGTVDANEDIYSNLDKVVNYLSKTKNESIPQDNVNIVINKKIFSKEAANFLSWIISQGQQYNRSFGFLNLDKSVVEKEQQQLHSLLLEQAAIK